MKFVVAYLMLQVLLKIVVGLQNPIILIAIPVGLVASYGLLILVYNFISGREFRL
jgi:hypothetical protein